MTRALLVLLPDRPDASVLGCPWWEVADGSILAHGLDGAWLARAFDTREPVVTVGLVGPEQVRLERRDAEALASPQERGVARIEAQRQALGSEPHVAVARDEMNGWIATVDAAAMRRWLEYGRAQEIEFDQIVPLASLLPADGKWHEARIGPTTVISRDGTALVDGDPLVDALVGDEFVDTLDHDTLMARLAAAVPVPPIDLRQGIFARARRWAPDPRRLKEFAVVVGLILLFALLIPIAKAIRWDSESDRLDRETAAIATAALGQPVEAEGAEAALLAAMGSGATGRGAGQLLASLFAEMEAERSVEAAMLGWDGSGALAARLVANDVDAINRLLLGLQRRGWSVTATPLADGQGRAMVDLRLSGNAA